MANKIERILLRTDKLLFQQFQILCTHGSSEVEHMMGSAKYNARYSVAARELA